jgi:hypothetical protein
MEGGGRGIYLPIIVLTGSQCCHKHPRSKAMARGTMLLSIIARIHMRAEELTHYGIGVFRRMEPKRYKTLLYASLYLRTLGYHHER